MYTQVKEGKKGESRLIPRKQNNNKGFFQLSDNRVEANAQKETKIAIGKSTIQKFTTETNASVVQLGGGSKKKPKTPVVYTDAQLWKMAKDKQASMARNHHPKTGAPGTPKERLEAWKQDAIRDLFLRMKKAQNDRLAKV